MIEDTRELNCAAENLVSLRTRDGAASLTDLVRSALRLRPDRIPIGEVRGGEALDLIKAWGTGHPGGVGTLHAGSALGALHRLEQLTQEVVLTPPRALIAETIDLIAVMAGAARLGAWLNSPRSRASRPPAPTSSDFIQSPRQETCHDPPFPPPGRLRLFRRLGRDRSARPRQGLGHALGRRCSRSWIRCRGRWPRSWR